MKCNHFIFVNPFEKIQCELEKDHEGSHSGTDSRNRRISWMHLDRYSNVTKGAGYESEDGT